MYYENFEKLCKKYNVTPSKVSKATGISTATLSSWKKGIYTPKQDKLQLIADYFNVSIDYLMTGEEKAHTDSIAAEYIDVMDMYARLSDEEKEQVVNMMKLFLKNK